MRETLGEVIALCRGHMATCGLWLQTGHGLGFLHISQPGHLEVLLQIFLNIGTYQPFQASKGFEIFQIMCTALGSSLY